MSIAATLSLLSLSETDYRGVKIDFSQLPDTAKRRTRKRAPTNVLVTGGAGYIGSQFVTLLLDQFVNIDTSSQTGGKFVTAYVEEKPDEIRNPSGFIFSASRSKWPERRFTEP